MNQFNQAPEISDLRAALSAVQAKLISQEAQIAAQNAKLNQLASQTVTTEQNQPSTSRRRWIKRLAVAAGMAAVGSTAMVSQPQVAKAAQISETGAYAGSHAIRGINTSNADNSGGVVGYASGPTNSGYGLLGRNDSNDGTGVYGLSVAPTNGVAIWATALGSRGIGIRSKASGFAILGETTGGASSVAIVGNANGQAKGIEATSVANDAITGVTLGPGSIGVYGIANSSNGKGVQGAASGVGGRAIHALATGKAWGMSAFSQEGIAIYGYAANGYAAMLEGKKANLFLLGEKEDPRNLDDTHQAGELYTDEELNLWYCVIDGTPGTWRKLAGAQSAGTLHLLTQPKRVLDTREATNSATSNVSGKLGAGEIRTYDVTNAATTIPDGAVALVGNLTITQPEMLESQSGFATLWPGGTRPDSSSINYIVPNKPVANSFTVRLSSGNLNLFSLRAAHVILDIAGYYL